MIKQLLSIAVVACLPYPATAIVEYWKTEKEKVATKENARVFSARLGEM